MPVLLGINCYMLCMSPYDGFASLLQVMHFGSGLEILFLESDVIFSMLDTGVWLESDTFNQISDVDLGGSPFRPVFQITQQIRCGNVVILDHGVSSQGVRQNVSMNLTSLERQGGDAVCGSAFMMEKTRWCYSRHCKRGFKTGTTHDEVCDLREGQDLHIKCCDPRSTAVYYNDVKRATLESNVMLDTGVRPESTASRTTDLVLHHPNGKAHAVSPATNRLIT
ncbi:hypothetical protein L6452_12553 [Arctium lappa]|uniref:Uncharacterized protein n=1 Tax=Arctium lappa TaxID=4217 RepID=A0ACB9DQQ1_ARCLA|nr:hypothetical protein L6452_12553 [Arctium lappa]